MRLAASRFCSRQRSARAGLALLLVALAASAAQGQEPARPTPDRDRYILGAEKQLQMYVHIIGQVQKPGEYQVPDGTDVLELISRAGGPTEYALLSVVRVTRVTAPIGPDGTPEPRVVNVNLDAYLANSKPVELLRLLPGDVVTIDTNGKYRWRFVAGILRDISVVLAA